MPNEKSECKHGNTGTCLACYEHHSHTHCFNQKEPPCGIPLEKHTQCCLCDLKFPSKNPMEEKLRAGAKDFAERFTGVMENLAEDDSMEEKRVCQCQQFTQNGVCEHLKQSNKQPQEEDWEVDFDKQFPVLVGIKVTPNYNEDLEKAKLLQQYWNNLEKNLKSFIKERVQEAEKKGWDDAFKHISKDLVMCYRTVFKKEGVGLYLPSIKQVQDDARQEERNRIVKMIENAKKKPTQHQIPCPDGKVGCLVYHCEMRLSYEDTKHNTMLDNIIKAITNES